MEKNTTDLKYLWILKKIVSWFLVIMSNVYNFAKENSGDFKTTVVSLENTLVSDFGPAYETLKELAKQILVFLDDKLDEYAPSLAKELVANFESIIIKTKPLVKILLATTQTIIIPLITITIFFLKTTKYLILSIVTTGTTKSTRLVSKTQSPLQKGLTTTQTFLQSSPLADTTQTLLQNTIDTTQSLAPDTILQKGSDLANQARDTTKSLVGGIPLVGNVADSLISNPTNVANQIFQKGPDLVNNTHDAPKSLFGGIPLMGNATDLANQIVNTTNSVVNKNPILEAVNSAAQSSLDNVAESLTTNPTDIANQILNTTNSLVNENPILEAVNSAAQNIGKQTQTTGTKAALQSAYMAMKLAGIPVIAQLWYEIVNEYPLVGELSEFILPVVESVFKLYNKLVTYMDEKGYKISGYLPLVPIDEMKDAYKLVKTSRDGLSAVGDVLGINNNKGLSAVGNMLGMNKNN